MRISQFISVCLVSALFAGGADAAATVAGCREIRLKGDDPVQAVTIPPSGACKVSMKDGYALPDPNCTPGAVNPSLTLKVLMRKGFGTKCVRDKASTPSAKAKTYDWYGIEHPAGNKGQNQVCELDHLISLEIGGADTLDNLWPQCGPDQVTLNERFFKQKDLVENYLAAQVRAKKMSLADAQAGIAKDWTQYLDDAKAYYSHHKKRNDGG